MTVTTVSTVSTVSTGTVDPFADWLEAGERFAGELGPVEVESALVDTLTAWLHRLRPVGQPEVTR